MKWQQIYEIRHDYIAEGFGDITVYVIYNKASGTHVLDKQGLTWYTEFYRSATNKARNLYNRDMRALEGAILGT